MFTEERRNDIYKMIKSMKSVSIIDLINKYQVSGTTIRTDLSFLEKNGKIIRTHGGAILNDESLSREKPILTRKDHYIMQKQKIVKKALTLIDDGDTILLDSGTTSLELAKLLIDTKDVTVITNDLQIALELQKMQNIYLIIIGGRVRNFFECTVGTMAFKYLQNLSVDKAFITANAVSSSKGLTTPSIENAEIKRAMMNIADKKYLICDSSKFGKKTACSFGQLEDLDIIITDSGISDELCNNIKKKNILMYIC